MWPLHTSLQPKGNRGAVLGVWVPEGALVPSPWFSRLRPRSHQLVKVSGVGYLAPLTFLAFAPATTARELLSVKHINDLLVRSVNAENILNVFSRIPWAAITDLTEFPQLTLSQVDKGFDCQAFKLMVKFEELKPVFSKGRRKGLTKVLPIKVCHGGPSLGKLIPVPFNGLFRTKKVFQDKSLSRVKEKQTRILEELARWFSCVATLLCRQELADVILRELHIVRRRITRGVNVQRFPNQVELAGFKQSEDPLDSVQILALCLRLEETLTTVAGQDADMPGTIPPKGCAEPPPPAPEFLNAAAIVARN